MNSHEAVEAESRCTREDRTRTMPSCATISTRYSGPLLAMVRSSDGDEATNQAVTAVIARPAHIQPYAARRNAAIRSAAASVAGKVVPRVMSTSAMADLLCCMSPGGIVHAAV